MTNIAQPGEPAPDPFVVVVNQLGQHSLWPAALPVPAGWRRQSGAMSRGDCLAAIEVAWPDIAPASVTARPEDQPVGDGERFVHELFAEQAAARPDAVAVAAGRTRVTYRELDESAGRLARHLRENGVGPEVVVGVHLERGIDLIRTILAIMRAGGGYLPLDPSLPAERLTMMCSQAGPAVVLTAAAASFPCPSARMLPLGELAADLTSGTDLATGTALDGRPHRDNLCYVIHTSGSTGDPKAVAVSYGSLASEIGPLAAEYQIGPEDRVAQMAAMAFDTSVEQIFVALTSGATLTLPPSGTLAPSELLRGIERRAVTVVDLTPAYWHQMLALTKPDDERLRSVRLMITGGEMADPADCQAALRAVPRARLLNAYGLTETTITSAIFDVNGWQQAEPWTAVPAGRPAGPARIMILDGQLNAVPPGGSGEVYIGGSGVARGYVGRPGLTAERFLPDPAGEAGSRMYRTGDIGRWLTDGTLEVAGRMDRQLKVRGYRVEPGEIETVLAGHPDIAEVSVVASSNNAGDTRLVAYYTPTGAAAQTTLHHPRAASLRRYLLDRLPSYMVPAAFVVRHPQNATARPGRETGDPHGTERTRAVPAQPRRPGGRGKAESLTPTQAGLSALWARMLAQDHVSLDDEFFALGGDSLLAAEMLAHTDALFGIPADSVRSLTRRLLRDPTLRAFAAAVEDARAGRLSTDGDQADVDFGRETRLSLKLRDRDAQAASVHDDASSRSEPDWRSPAEVLLTGAAGFLGAHLLSELLAATGARVHCLVRARDENAVLSRLRHAADRYELPVPRGERVVPLPGDLAEPQLGLSDARFHDLAGNLDVIYHVGAQVNFIYPYQDLRAANVTGTRELIRLAAMDRAIPLHYVSSTAVLAGLGVAGVREVTEETPLAHPELLRMGYVETKYVAEELLRAAGRAGLPMAIYRPLDIVGSVRTGAWSTSTEMAAMIRFIADTGLAPDIDLPLDFVPADACAAAIRHISVAEGADGRTYHLASPEMAPLGTLVGRMRAKGYRIADIPFDDWVNELARQAARDPSHPMAAFLPLFVGREAGGLTVAEMYLSHVFPVYGRSNTEHALLGSGIAFPPVSGELLDRNVERLMQTGYLPAPQAGHLPAHAG